MYLYPILLFLRFDISYLCIVKGEIPEVQGAIFRRFPTRHYSVRLLKNLLRGSLTEKFDLMIKSMESLQIGLSYWFNLSTEQSEQRSYNRMAQSIEEGINALILKEIACG